MDFFRVRKVRKPHVLNAQEGLEIKSAPAEETKKEGRDDLPKANAADSSGEIEEDEDDDDFFTNEVKRRLKELRKKNFMVLIPEESCPEEDDEEEASSGEWKESEVEDGYPWCGFDTLYDKYSERMQFFDKMIIQLMKEHESDQRELEEGCSDSPVHAADLIKIIGSSIMTFRLFLKMDKKKSGVLNLFGGLNQVESSLQQIQTSLGKKEAKLKELSRKKKGWKKKPWPTMAEEVELLFGLIDIKVVSRVLRMVRISKEQLLWCEEKMSKLDIPESKLQRDGSPVLFPC